MTDDTRSAAAELANPHLEAEEADDGALAPDAAPLTVLLFDPSNPGHPRKELAANFDPAIHVRWEARAAIATIDLRSLDMSPDEVDNLTVAKLDNLKSVLAAGRDGLQKAGLSPSAANAYLKWAMSRAAAAHALAEIELEAAQKPPAPPKGEQERVTDDKATGNAGTLSVRTAPPKTTVVPPAKSATTEAASAVPAQSTTAASDGKAAG